MNKTDVLFCKQNCKYLNITEKEQDEHRSKGYMHTAHYCKKYNKSLYHLRYHPNIIKIGDCNE